MDERILYKRDPMNFLHKPNGFYENSDPVIGIGVTWDAKV